MSNREPKQTSSYKDHPEPALWTRDVLIWIADGGDITSPEIADQFNIQVADASKRLSMLMKWGCLKRVKSGRRFIYSITEWGRKMAEKWREGK